MKKKLLSTITILCMLCAFLPTIVSAENQMLEQGIIVKADGIYIGTSETAATPEELASYGISFTAGSPAKLTLNNTTIITGTGVDANTQISNKTVNSAIYTTTSVEIQLIGTNLIENKSEEENKYLCGIYSSNDLSLTGTNASLKIDLSVDTASNANGSGIYCDTKFTNNVALTINGYKKVNGLYAKSSVTNNGSIVSEASNDNFRFTHGIYSDGTLTNNGSIIAKGSTNGVRTVGILTNNGTIDAQNYYASSDYQAAVNTNNSIINFGTISAKCNGTTNKGVGIRVMLGTLENKAGGKIVSSGRYAIYLPPNGAGLSNSGEIDLTSTYYALYYGGPENFSMPAEGAKITVHGGYMTFAKNPVELLTATNMKKYGTTTIADKIDTTLYGKNYQIYDNQKPLVLENKKLVLSVDAAKNYTVNIKIGTLEGTVLVALYDGDRLVKINAYPLSDSANLTGSFTENGTKVKAFWWNSLENMTPKAFADVKVIPTE